MNRRASAACASCLVLAVAAHVTACGAVTSGTDASTTDGDDAVSVDASTDALGERDADTTRLPDGRVVRGPYATRVVSFEAGEGGGFGQDRMPDIVLGPPVGGGDARGSTDTVSLGRNGRICIAFDDVTIVDGPGVDFVVFENPFYVSGTATLWRELGEVSVSEDGVSFTTYPCDPTVMGPPYPGCAGWNPVYSRPDGISPTDVINAGGDAFDLASIGLRRARVVCIRDLGSEAPAPPTTGFDLDAIAAVNFE